jgi:hypothetical protein
LRKNGQDVECPTCGASFYLRASRIALGRRFCSPQCALAPRATKTKPCSFCRLPFKPRQSRHIYCSAACRNAGMGKTKSGPNNTNWNGGVSRRQKSTAKSREWTSAVFERDNYTCVACCRRYGRKLEAHHKDAYHWCADRRFDVSNGVTVCRPCHKEFHTEFGLKNNTEAQWNEFIGG